MSSRLQKGGIFSGANIVRTNVAIFLIAVIFQLNSKEDGRAMLFGSDSKRSSHRREPALETFFSAVIEALQSANVTYWILPSSGLMRTASSPPIYCFSPWLTGTSLGVFHDDVLLIALAVHALEAAPKSWSLRYVETHGGMRLFAKSTDAVETKQSQRYDYSEPYVDLTYFRHESGHITSKCCDCDGLVIGSCTKKTCGCVKCAYPEDKVLPLGSARISDVRGAVSFPAKLESLQSALNWDGVHPFFAQEHVEG